MIALSVIEIWQNEVEEHEGLKNVDPLYQGLFKREDYKNVINLLEVVYGKKQCNLITPWQ